MAIKFKLLDLLGKFTYIILVKKAIVLIQGLHVGLDNDLAIKCSQESNFTLQIQ